MDPITVLSAATAAFKGIKALVDAGREVEDVFGQLNGWAGKISDLKSWCTQQESKPSIFKKLKLGDSSKQAMDTVQIRFQIKQQETQMREMMQWYGPAGMYEEFVAEREAIDKRNYRMIKDQMVRRKEFIETAIYSILILAILVAGGSIGYVIYMATN